MVLLLFSIHRIHHKILFCLAAFQQEIGRRNNKHGKQGRGDHAAHHGRSNAQHHLRTRAIANDNWEETRQYHRHRHRLWPVRAAMHHRAPLAAQRPCQNAHRVPPMPAANKSASPRRIPRQPPPAR